MIVRKVHVVISLCDLTDQRMNIILFYRSEITMKVNGSKPSSVMSDR